MSRQTKKIFSILVACLLVFGMFLGYRYIHSSIRVNLAYNKYQQVTQKIQEQIEPYLIDGMSTIDNVDNILAQVYQYAGEMYTQGVITNYSYSPGDSCVYMEIDGWFGMIYDVPVKDSLAGGSDEISIVTIEPYASDFDVWASYVASGAKGPDEAAKIIERAFDNFSFESNLEDNAVTVESVKNLPSHSIIIWIGHGSHSSRLDNPTFSGSCIAVQDDGTDLQTLLKYREEIGNGAIYVTSSGALCLTPIFFEQYMPSNALEGSVVYISACYSAADSKLAQSILNKGAIAYLGNTCATWQIYGFKMPYTFFEALTPTENSGYVMSIMEALTYAKAKHGDTDPRTHSQVAYAMLYDFTLPEMIPLMGEVFDVLPDFELSVYGENKALYDDYSLYITKARALGEYYLTYGENVNIDDIIAHCMDCKKTETADDVLLNLDPGIYELALVDNKNAENVQIITIQVLNETGSNTLSISTNFGSKIPENTIEIGEPQKLLTQVNGCHSNGDCEQYTFSYNESNLVVHYSTDYYSVSGDRWHHEYDIDYNGNGQLTRYQEVGNVNPYLEQHYSADGVLTGWSSWEYDSLQLDYTCEYDEQGRRIREFTNGISTDYTYNEEGFLISSSTNTEWGDMKGTTVSTYSYDTERRLIQMVSTSDWDGYIQSETIKYGYEYEPFVLRETCYDGTYSYTDLLHLSGELSPYAEIHVDESASFEVMDGYLIKISGKDYSYEFFYNGETDDSFLVNLPPEKYEDELTGMYITDYGNITITITADRNSEYYLTYAASGVTLKNIPMAYFECNTTSEKEIMFDVGAYYPEYVGNVSFRWNRDGIYQYTFNASIEGLEGSEGVYFPLTEVGICVYD